MNGFVVAPGSFECAEMVCTLWYNAAWLSADLTDSVLEYDVNLIMFIWVKKSYG